jgi:hypothetical protein
VMLAYKNATQVQRYFDRDGRCQSSPTGGPSWVAPAAGSSFGFTIHPGLPRPSLRSRGRRWGW